MLDNSQNTKASRTAAPDATKEAAAKAQAEAIKAHNEKVAFEKAVRWAKKTTSSENQAAMPGGHKGGLGTPCENTGRSDPRAERFKLQTTAKAILKGVLTPKNKPYRISHCLRTVTDKVHGVDVLITKEGSANFHGLQSCGSVWACRLCQEKITRQRELEIQSAMDLHFADKGTCLMITFTHSHRSHHKLKSLLKRYVAAKSLMTSWRAYKKLIKEYGLNGHIKALEATFGWANGWHPHGHELHFATGKVDKKQRLRLKRRLFVLWYKACKKADLPLPSYKYGVDVSVAWSAAEYMQKFGRDQKWGAGKELTRLNSKTRNKELVEDERFTPMDLLRAYEKNYKKDDMQRLFREYTAAYHGKHQCQWSRGLKKRFNINVLTDEQIAENIEGGDVPTLAGNINYYDWRKMIRQPKDLRFRIIHTVELQGMPAAKAYIDALPGPTESDRAKPRETVDPDTGEVFSTDSVIVEDLMKAVKFTQPKPEIKPGVSHIPPTNFIPPERPELREELAQMDAFLEMERVLAKHLVTDKVAAEKAGLMFPDLDFDVLYE